MSGIGMSGIGSSMSGIGLQYVRHRSPPYVRHRSPPQASVLRPTQMNQPSPTAHSNVCMQNARPRFFERLHGVRHHSPIIHPRMYLTLTLSHYDTYRCCAWRSPRAPKCTWRVSERGTVCSKIIRSLYKLHHTCTLNPEPLCCNIIL